MSDYISREAAIAAVHEHFDGILVYDESGETAANEVEDILLGLTPFIPIISKTDVRPVVLCRDCKNWETDWMPNHAKNYEHFCPMVGLVTSPNWFCAYGERRGADMRPAPEPPAETTAPICQTCGNFEACPWQNDGNMTEYIRTTKGRVVACSDYKDKKG